VVSWFLKAVHEKDASATPTAQSLVDDNRAVLIAARYVYVHDVRSLTLTIMPTATQLLAP
jgi:hypothetical protein